MHLVWIVLKTDWIKLDPKGWVSSWTSPLNPRPCHAGWPQGKATQVKHKVSTTWPVFAARCYLCISAAYAVMRCLCVCVCVSVTFVNCVKTDKHIIKKFFHHRVVPSFSFFHAKHMPGFSACCWSCNRPDVVNTVAGGPRVPPSRKLWHIAVRKLRCWLREKTTKCLLQEASTLRQRQ